MTTLFSLSFLLVAPFWLLIVFLPHWHVTRRIISSPWIAAPAALLYTVLAFPHLRGLLPVLIQPELESVRALLARAEGTTIAWVHFLAFDIFVGRWIYLDSRKRGLRAWLVSPILFVTLMLGPFGLLSYLVVRRATARLSR